MPTFASPLKENSGDNVEYIKIRNGKSRIRLQRHGKKGNAFYYIVVADARAPRDGRFVERLGFIQPEH